MGRPVQLLFFPARATTRPRPDGLPGDQADAGGGTSEAGEGAQPDDGGQGEQAITRS